VGPQANILERISYGVSSPFIRAVSWVRDKGSYLMSEYVLIRDSRQENRQLREELGQLRARLLKTEEEQGAWHRQRDHYRKLGVATDSGLVAQVVSQEPKSYFRTLTIDRGAQDGIVPDQVVVADGGLVGRVIQVDSTRSKVLLITDLRSAVAVLDVKTRARGTLVGRQKKLRLGRDHWLTQAEYILAKEEIRSGDLLLTSGLDGLFPHGIPVGVVRTIKKDGAGLFWKAEVQPYVETQTLETVLVLTDSGIPEGPGQTVGVRANLPQLIPEPHKQGEVP